jgi:GDPmannose 4,6-dehydratase
MLQQDDPARLRDRHGRVPHGPRVLRVAFAHVGLDWEPFVEDRPAYYRPTEVEHLHADPSRAMAELGWKPRSASRSWSSEMVDADLAYARA